MQYILPVKPGDGFDGSRTATGGDQARGGIADVLICDYLVLLGGPPCTPDVAIDSRLGIDDPGFEWPLARLGGDLTMPESVEGLMGQHLGLADASKSEDDGRTPCPSSSADQRHGAVH